MLATRRVIHCDLKPENILLRSRHSSRIKVIDFGSACYDTEKVHSYIQSRFYRSPEVILGAEYGCAIDMWSFGCIMSELHTGRPIFPGRNEQEQLTYCMEVLGVPSRGFLDRCKRSRHFFTTSGHPKSTRDTKGRNRRPGTRGIHKATKSNDALFNDFIMRCLAWDPRERMTPKQARLHPWIVQNIKRNRRRRSASITKIATAIDSQPLPASTRVPVKV